MITQPGDTFSASQGNVLIRTQLAKRIPRPQRYTIRSSASQSIVSTRTQRPIEATDTVHVLSVLCLLLFPDTIDLIAWHLCVLRRLERSESHHLSNHRVDIILVQLHLSINSIHCGFDIFQFFALFPRLSLHSWSSRRRTLSTSRWCRHRCWGCALTISKRRTRSCPFAV